MQIALHRLRRTEFLVRKCRPSKPGRSTCNIHPLKFTAFWNLCPKHLFQQIPVESWVMLDCSYDVGMLSALNLETNLSASRCVFEHQTGPGKCHCLGIDQKLLPAMGTRTETNLVSSLSTKQGLGPHEQAGKHKQLSVHKIVVLETSGSDRVQTTCSNIFIRTVS